MTQYEGKYQVLQLTVIFDPTIRRFRCQVEPKLAYVLLNIEVSVESMISNLDLKQQEIHEISVHIVGGLFMSGHDVVLLESVSLICM